MISYINLVCGLFLTLGGFYELFYIPQLGLFALVCGLILLFKTIIDWNTKESFDWTQETE